MRPPIAFLTSFDMVDFNGKFILFYIIKNLKFKFYYKNVDLGKKNLDINNKKKLMKEK